MPGVDLAAEAVDRGNCSGTEVDKFETFRLTQKQAETVDARLISECLANIECKVKDASLAGKCNLFKIILL